MDGGPRNDDSGAGENRLPAAPGGAIPPDTKPDWLQAGDAAASRTAAISSELRRRHASHPDRD
jgi:hypothetical protein